MHEGQHDADLLPVAFGERAHGAVQDDVEPFDEVVEEGAVAHAAHAGCEVYVRATRQALVQRQLPGQVADPFADGHPVAHGIQTEYVDSPGSRPVEAEQEADRRRLACPVRAEEAVHLAATYLKAEVAHAPVHAEGLGEAIGTDQSGHDGPPIAPERALRGDAVSHEAAILGPSHPSWVLEPRRLPGPLSLTAGMVASRDTK